MTLEIRRDDSPEIFEDEGFITMGQLRTRLGIADHGRIFTAAKREGIRPIFTNRNIEGSRQLYRVSDFPKVARGLAHGRSQYAQYFPPNTESDFQFVAPSGATIIYRYPKK